MLLHSIQKNSVFTEQEIHSTSKRAILLWTIEQ